MSGKTFFRLMKKNIEPITQKLKIKRLDTPNNDYKNYKALTPTNFVSKIKQSVAGEALAFGDFVPMPMHIKIKKANPEPHSSNCQISQEWYPK